MKRARRKCCPQIPTLLSSQAPPQPTRMILRTNTLNSNGKEGSNVMGSKKAASAVNKKSVTASRALQLVNKSKIVTAQQKVKEKKDEEEEREVERERKLQQSKMRTRKSEALFTSALNTINDTKVWKPYNFFSSFEGFFPTYTSLLK